MWYLQAYEFVSTQYIMNMYPNWSGGQKDNYFMIAEGNPDLVYEVKQGEQEGELIEFHGINFYFMHDLVWNHPKTHLNRFTQ